MKLIEVPPAVKFLSPTTTILGASAVPIESVIHRQYSLAIKYPFDDDNDNGGGGGGGSDDDGGRAAASYQGLGLDSDEHHD